MKRYVNYHKHSHYSNIMTPDCIIKPVDIAERAVQLGHKTLVTTEHGYAGNVFEYYSLAKKYNLKFIFGIEFYYVNDRHEKDKTNTHLMIVAKNKDGMKQMNRILSEANKTGYYYKPRIDKELVLSLNPDDVFLTSTCAMSYVGRCDDYEENFIIPFMNHFKKNFYLEIQPHVHTIQIEYNKKILNLHKKYGIPLIHANDSHYIFPEQAKERDLFLRGKNIWYPEEEGFILDYPDVDELFRRYDEQGVFTEDQVRDAIENTLIMEDFEDIEMDDYSIKMPTLYPTWTHEQKVKKLKEIISKEWNKDKQHIFPERHPEYKKAIQEEMKIIEETQTEDYFLLNYEIIKRGKEKGGILTRTGRGSAPSFYINKLLGFTEIDRVDAPIPLYPTRFMSKTRILQTRSLPDIDFNTADPQPFIEAMEEILGKDNCYYMIAYGTMKISEAFRCMCRAHEIPMDEYNPIGKELSKNEEEAIEKYKDDPKWGELIKKAQELFLGVIVSASPHPCAHLLLDKPISEEIGVLALKSENSTEVTYCALIDSKTADKWKYLKNDILTVKVWEIISETFKLLNKPIPDIRQLTELTKNNKKVWKLYELGLTATLNQAGTDSGTPQVVRYKPKNIAELSAWVAAIRPGFASMKDIFLDRQEFSYGIPEFDKILESSSGFCLYQENVMATLMFAGFPEDLTYGIIKQISKKTGNIQEIKDQFIKGFIEKTGSEENALKVWKIIEDNADYSFNSSHSLSVALDSLYGAYLKAEYPLAYYSVVLNLYEDDQDTTSKIYKELDYFGIKVLPIKFGKSGAKYQPDFKTNTIYKGLKSIKYLNEKIANELMELSQNHYDNPVDLFIDIKEKTSVNSRQMNILIKLNFFSEFGGNQFLLDLYEMVEKRYKKTHKDKTKQARIQELKAYYEENKDNRNRTINLGEQILFEKEHLGYAQTINPKAPKSVAVVIGSDTKYTPKLTMYQLATGKEAIFKMDKRQYYTNPLEVGDVIKIIGTSNKERVVKTQEGWVKTGKYDTYIEGYMVIEEEKITRWSYGVV